MKTCIQILHGRILKIEYHVLWENIQGKRQTVKQKQKQKNFKLIKF